MDAETTYKAQVEEANKLTKILERVKVSHYSNYVVLIGLRS